MSDKTARSAKSLLPVLLLFWLANLVFLLRFADRDGYEGDDLNSILPMAHLDAAKHGLLLIYRYAWQPLSYELGSLTWALTGTPTAVFLLAPIAGASALALLFWWLWREGTSRAAPWIALIALLGIPELWFSALYYNSTILGMPLLAGALLLVRRGTGLVAPAIAGVLTGLAILLRMDFVLVCPLLAVAAWPRGNGISRPIMLATIVVATLLVGFLAGWLDPAEILKIQAASAAEIREKAHVIGWDLRMKASVASISLSPAGWLMLLGGGALALLDALKRRDWRALLWLGAALPATYPLFSILSPKYALPLAPFLLLLFVHGLTLAESCLAGRLRNPAVAVLVVAAAVPVFVSASLYGHAPFVGLSALPERPVNTHDGPRGYGGYLWQMMATDAVSEQPPEQRTGTDLAQALGRENILFLGGENYFDKGSVGWRHLQLILEKRGVHGVLMAPHVLRFDFPDKHQLVLAGALVPVSGAFRTVDMRTPTDEH